MSELACNIVLYRPDPALLAARYRHWQVEALLEQAAGLVERSLRELRDYCALDFAWHELEGDLEAQENKLGVYRQVADQEVLAREVPPPAPGEHPAAQAMVAREASESEASLEPHPAPAAPLKSSLDCRVEALQRKRELSGPGGPFALNEQRDLALRRLCRDYEEAVDRACVAEQGLERCYGQSWTTRPLPSEAETLGVSISNLALWVRNAQQWLACRRLLEEPFTRAVSARALLNRNSWALLRHARDSFTMKLQIPVDLFRGHDNCRVRAVAAYLVGEAGTVPWSLALRLPEEAVYERSGQSFEVDQSARPGCLLGRVENRRVPQPPERGGRNGFRDASPIGRPTQGGLWSLELFKPAGASSETFSHLEDLVLEIDTVGLPR
jgi:hypothetical protein